MNGITWRRKWMPVLIALAIAIVVLLSSYADELAIAFSKDDMSTFEIPLREKTSQSQQMNGEGLQEYVRRGLYVPNYDAKVLITPAKNPVTVGENVLFNLRIEDAGIIKMKEPFFYIYLQDPEGNIEGCFPSCEFNKYVASWQETDRPSSSSGGFYSLDDPVLVYAIDDKTYAFYRDQLVQGSGIYRFEVNTHLLSSNNQTFYFSYPAEKVGNWQIHVLVFDKQYRNRDDTLYSTYDYERSDKKHIVAYVKNVVAVRGQEQEPASRSFSYLKLFGALIGAVGAFTLVYLPLRKRYDGFERFIRKVYAEKYVYVGILIILAIFMLLWYLIT